MKLSRKTSFPLLSLFKLHLLCLIFTGLAGLSGTLQAQSPTPFPSVQQGGKLFGTTPTDTGGFEGSSVALSADGNTAVVGVYNDNNGIGAILIFVRNSGIWTQQGPKLIGSGSVGTTSQGQSVAISADGNTVIEGGFDDATGEGGVWIFTRTGGVWTQQGNQLSFTGAGTNASVGSSVALSADGKTALVGGTGANRNFGAAWVFTDSAGFWSQQGNKLVGTGAVDPAYQGSSAAPSADGNTAFVGASGDNAQIGAVWVYTRSGGVWTQVGSKLVGTGNAGRSYQGESVSVSSDGTTLFVGADGDNNNMGAAWVFTQSGGVWTQQGNKLTGNDAMGPSWQGLCVSLSGDGNTALVGGPYDNIQTGATWVYTRTAGVWTQQGSKLIGSGAVGDAYQGQSVSISTDANTAMIGGFNDNGGHGAAWVFVSSATQGIEEEANSFQLLVYPNPSFGSFTIRSSREGDYTILNSLGQNIHRFRLTGEMNYSSSVSDLSAGVYFLTGMTKEGMTRQKIVVGN